MKPDMAALCEVLAPHSRRAAEALQGTSTPAGDVLFFTAGTGITGPDAAHLVAWASCLPAGDPRGEALEALWEVDATPTGIRLTAAVTSSDGQVLADVMTREIHGSGAQLSRALDALAAEAGAELVLQIRALVASGAADQIRVRHD